MQDAHAAYDRRILGITPTYEVRINAAVLREIDGPMLLHGIQEFHGRSLMVLPERRTERPDRALLKSASRPSSTPGELETDGPTPWEPPSLLKQSGVVKIG